MANGIKIFRYEVPVDDRWHEIESGEVLPGQLVGKATMTALAVLLLAVLRRVNRRRAA